MTRSKTMEGEYNEAYGGVFGMQFKERRYSMSETYCGKTCEGCKHKESLNCPGCKAGPGRQHSGDCELAQCCRSKGHERCETCGFNINCGTLRGRESVPEHRRWKIEADAEWKERLTRRAKILGKWLWLLFWLVIPSTVAGVLTNEAVVERIPSFYVP